MSREFSRVCCGFVTLSNVILVVLSGAGVGLTTSANSLALNTYFKERRRVVTGISWSCTALGPIIFPHVVNYLLPRFGVQRTVLIFSGIAMNSICCALLLQPVRWHVKKKAKENTEENLINQVPEIECHYCQSLKKKPHSLVSSQYLHNVDDYLATGYEIIDPGTPMIARANDGWYSSSSAKRSLYGSKVSLNSKKSSRKTSLSTRPSFAGNSTPKKSKPLSETVTEKIEECPTEDCVSHKSPQDIRSSQQKLNPISLQHFKTSPATPTASHPPFLLKQVSESKYLKDNKSNRSMQSQSFRSRANTFNLEKEVLNIARNKLEKYADDVEQRAANCRCDELRADTLNQKQIEQEIDDGDAPKFTLWQKIFIFFDLDLLKDLTFINIMVGVTIANFAELNFSVLTPFVLDEFGLEHNQIAFCMSLLGWVVDS